MHVSPVPAAETQSRATGAAHPASVARPAASVVARPSRPAAVQATSAPATGRPCSSTTRTSRDVGRAPPRGGGTLARGQTTRRSEPEAAGGAPWTRRRPSRTTSTSWRRPRTDATGTSPPPTGTRENVADPSSSRAARATSPPNPSSTSPPRLGSPEGASTVTTRPVGAAGAGGGVGLGSTRVGSEVRPAGRGRDPPLPAPPGQAPGRKRLSSSSSHRRRASARTSSSRPGLTRLRDAMPRGYSRRPAPAPSRGRSTPPSAGGLGRRASSSRGPRAGPSSCGPSAP